MSDLVTELKDLRVAVRVAYKHCDAGHPMAATILLAKVVSHLNQLIAAQKEPKQ